MPNDSSYNNERIDLMSTNPVSQNVIIFIHGLSGSADGTWGKMIEFFRRDSTFSSYALDTYEYPTCKINLAFWRKLPGIQELADGLSTFIQTYHSDKKSIILIGHSLGGLVLRYYILNAFKQDRSDALTAAIMIATPHTGAALGRIGNTISFRHAHLKQLTKGGDLLRSILDDWSHLKIEQKIQTLYITGGMDAIVDGDSSKPFHGNDRAKNLISFGHIDVIKPAHAGDIRFLTLKQFIGALETPANSRIQQAAPGSPLFYRYQLECEAFYLHRDLDNELERILLGSNVWLSGPSGTGKSVALTRAILKKGWNLLYFTLDGYSEMPAQDLLNEICRSLMDRAGIDDSRLPTDAKLSVTLRFFSSALSALQTTSSTAMFIEEIPITDDTEYSRFVSLAYHLSLLQDTMQYAPRIVWVFGSIANPEKYLKEQNIKIRERFNFIGTSTWSDGDIRKLLGLICREMNITFSEDQILLIINTASGSPRTLKMFLKAYQTEVGRNKPLPELLSEISMETP